MHFHAGTAESIAEVLLYEKTELLPGEAAFVQLRLADEVVVVRGDRFIVRQFSPVITIGGGEVLDPLARRADAEGPWTREVSGDAGGGSREEILRAMVERNILGLGMQEIVPRTGWMEAEVRAAAEKLGKGRRDSRGEPRSRCCCLAEPVFRGSREKTSHTRGDFS